MEPKYISNSEAIEAIDKGKVEYLYSDVPNENTGKIDTWKLFLAGDGTIKILKNGVPRHGIPKGFLWEGYFPRRCVLFVEK